jgi:penicillin-binding protein 1B
MAKKKSPVKKRKTTRANKKPERSGFIRWSTVFKILFTLSVLAFLLLVFLDIQIRSQFEGKRWALPAKVYARPLELYSGAPISVEDLHIELSGLGYQFVRSPKQPGQAALSSHRIELISRGFHFGDQQESSRRLNIDFNGQGIASIHDPQAGELALIQLEPILIGGIYPLNNEDRELIQLKDAPASLIAALIAIEDRDFYDHHGISLKGISRAMLVNIKAGQFIQGGSTLTQQLIKNFYLSADRTLVRKLLEIPMAVLLDYHYSKDDILEAYLNEVYLGQDGARAIHGFGLGAHYLFAQPLQELELHQVALLAAMVKGPSYYNPRRHPERAKARRDLVLKVLMDQGEISDKQYRDAMNKPLGVVKKGTLLKEAFPAYLDLVKRQLTQHYRESDLRTEGLLIFTSLDPIVQRRAEEALTQTVDRLEARFNSRVDNLQGSMVVTDPRTGEVLALIGDKQTRYQGFNRALDAVRPIGSLVKPAVYLTALENGYTLASPIDDSDYSLELAHGQVWSPQNFDKQDHGQVMLIDALTHSYNASTARLGMDVGLDPVISTLEKMGVKRPLKPYPSLLLGAQGLSPIEVATAYQTIASNGFMMLPRSIRTVTDSQGQTLSSYPFQLKQTLNADSLYLLEQAMQAVTHQGTARSIYQVIPSDIQVAGKTGTSDEQRDSWFAGFSANRLAVVWMGQDNNASLPFTGSGGALQAWIQFMRTQSLESLNTPQPENIEWQWVDTNTGERTGEDCGDARALPFIIGTEPQTATTCLTESENNPVSRSLDWIKSWF